jgi:hypothetical protein
MRLQFNTEKYRARYETTLADQRDACHQIPAYHIAYFPNYILYYDILRVTLA